MTMDRKTWAGQHLSRRNLLIYSGGGLTLGALTLAGCSDDEAPNPFDDAAGGSDALESPMLTERVDAGDLPSLEERLPAEPMVVEPWDGPGAFGGTLHRAQTDVADAGVMQSFAGVGLLEWDWDAAGAVPSIAAEFEKNETNTQFTFRLREGMKWSDGEPFTSEDLMFTITDYLSNETTIPTAPFWFSDGGNTRPSAEAPDELTVVITYTEPFSLFEKYMCHPAVSYQFLKPKHYLSQFHPDYADPEEVDAATSEAGFDSWDQYFADRDNWWTNPERPVLGAYLVTSSANAQSGTAALERNPYYWKTDPDGRQLPYVDEIQVQVLAQDALDLRAANGDLDFQGHFLGYNTAQVYLQNAESKGFEMLRWQPVGTLASICLNLSHQNDVLRELFLDVEFRRALSLGIDREEMNSTLVGDLGTIAQPIPTENSEYFVEGTGQNAIEFDPDEANRILDDLGLTMGTDGVRQRPDGEPLALVLMYVESSAGISPADAYGMVRRNWADIGVKLDLRPVDGGLYGELRGSNDFDIDGTTIPTDDFDLEPVWFIPTASNSHSAPGYGGWYASAGAEGMEPPQDIKDLMDRWDDLRTAETDEDRIAAGQAITSQHEEQIYAIGLVALPFTPVIVAGDLHNVRDDEPQLSYYKGREGITKPEQIYFAEA
ncbi:ABC transporter substrate-binding protein [Ruania zhangjianzhongii]|uniref:ABC transporter substrate-binding protein n=1 Tax=Ruania zhangjianzhongii TaxID=2603206 RepID=UPI0011C6F9D5|nr:ABC transporter substrate-binding protein [Ruania zhangjianzhongii]